MEIINTIVPIPLDLMKRKFTEEVSFVIDYTNSKFKGKSFLTYLSNVDIECSVKCSGLEESLDLLKYYMATQTLVSLPELDNLVMNILLYGLGLPNDLEFDPEEYVNENSESFARWVRRLFALPLFAATLLPNCGEVVNQYPVDEDESFSGINFVNLIKHPMFDILMASVKPEQYTYNKKFFSENVFGSKNLFHHFAIESNGLFTTILAIAEPETHKKLLDALEVEKSELVQLLGELNNVPTV